MFDRQILEICLWNCEYIWLFMLDISHRSTRQTWSLSSQINMFIMWLMSPKLSSCITWRRETVPYNQASVVVLWEGHEPVTSHVFIRHRRHTVRIVMLHSRYTTEHQLRFSYSIAWSNDQKTFHFWIMCDKKYRSIVIWNHVWNSIINYFKLVKPCRIWPLRSESLNSSYLILFTTTSLIQQDALSSSVFSLCQLFVSHVRSRHVLFQLVSYICRVVQQRTSSHSDVISTSAYWPLWCFRALYPIWSSSPLFKLFIWARSLQHNRLVTVHYTCLSNIIAHLFTSKQM